MKYRRNSDSKLRDLEREYFQSNDVDLIVPLNRARRQSGLPPLPQGRAILANNYLFEALPKFASALLTLMEVYDEIDIPMYLHELGDAPIEEAGGLRAEVVSLVDEIARLTEESRACSRASTDFMLTGDYPDDYLELLRQGGMGRIPLGMADEEDEEEQNEERFHFFSAQSRKQMSRDGHEANLEQLGWMHQLVCRRALRIFRKLLLYGAIPINQILENEPGMGNAWFDYQLSDMDDMADTIEIAINEIIDVSQGFGPSQEAIERFSKSWYRD
jgi:hypothetical protein